MLDRLQRPAVDVGVAAPPTSLAGRQALFFSLVAASMAGLLWLLAAALSVGGLDAFDLALLALFAVTLPWSVIGFWNASIGFLIMRFARNPTAVVCPVAARIRGDEPIAASTAILVCIRNEAPERVLRNLKPLMTGLVAAGVGERFHIYVLSDTSDPAIAAAEASQFDAFAGARAGQIPLTYRRRAVNAGFKAGNIRDFCERWGRRHELAVTLDADSFMTAEAVLRLVRVMQVNPRLGILQGLVVGMPSTSAFARIFQFGMRLGMRSYTIGSAWWQADCGPYWGHNAIVRIAPFMAHCQLPVLAAGALVQGHVLSHDQIEAVLMRKAGYDVRILPEEGSSFEQNPPTIVEFVRRDLRWCQGNMQYWHFLAGPDLATVSRYQLVLALLMFLGSPAWIGLLLLGASGAAMTSGALVRPDIGLLLLGVVLVLWFAPNLATMLDILSRSSLRQSFGGGTRLLASFFTSAAFILLLAPIMWASHTIFFARLLLGRTMDWKSQTREDHRVSLRVAVREFWPHTLIGFLPLLLLGITARSAIPVALLIAAGPLLSIPFSVATASPTVSRLMIGAGLCRVPEESDPPAELLSLELPALKLLQRGC
ncbi:MAG: glucans biosynthesis glucosyltransferase MdoH [Xanthobacteraceae bacterium]